MTASRKHEEKIIKSTNPPQEKVTVRPEKHDIQWTRISTLPYSATNSTECSINTKPYMLPS